MTFLASTVGSGVGQVEALVHDRKVGDNVAQDGFAQGGPVLQRRVFDFTTGQTVVGRRSNPVKNLATPAFDIAEGDAIGGQWADLGSQGAGRQPVEHLLEDGERLVNLFASHDEAALHVAFAEDGHDELDLVVIGVREIAAQVVVEAGSAAGDAHHAEVSRDFGLEYAGGFQAVARAGGFTNQFDQRFKLWLQPGDELLERLELVGIKIETHAAQAGHAAQQAVARELLVGAKHAFLEAHGVGVGDDKRHIGGNGADVRDMIVDALQFQADRAQRPSARRRLDGASAFNRVTEGRRVAEAGISGNAFRQPDTVLDLEVFKKFFRPFVRVEQPDLQIKNRLARNAEQKVARLDNSGVHRSDRHLKYSFAFDRAELVSLALEGRKLRAQVEVLAQGKNLRPVVVQRAAARVGMADQFQPEQVLDFPLLPVDGMNGVGQRGEFRFVRRDRHAQDQKAVRRVEGENIVHVEHPVGSAGIVGEQTH